MTAVWYYARDGKQSGPLPVEQLRQLVASRQLLPTDHLWQPGLAGWVLASTVPEVFPPSAPAPTAGPAAGGGQFMDWLRNCDPVLDALDETPAEAGPKPEAAPTSRQQAVQRIACAVAGAAGLALLFSLGRLLNLSVRGGRISFLEGPFLTLALLYNAAILPGAWEMARLRRYSLARSAGILVLGSWPWLFFTDVSWWFVLPCTLFGIAAGTLALVLLLNPEVKAGFGQQSSLLEVIVPLWLRFRQPRALATLVGTAAFLVLLNAVILLQPAAPGPAASGSSNSAGKLVGSWRLEKSTRYAEATLDFTADGKVVLSPPTDESDHAEYRVSGTTLVISRRDAPGSPSGRFDFELPSDDVLMIGSQTNKEALGGLFPAALAGTWSRLSDKTSTPEATADGRKTEDARLYGKWEMAGEEKVPLRIEFARGGGVTVRIEDPPQLRTGQFEFLDRATIRARQDAGKGDWEMRRIGFPSPDELRLLPVDARPESGALPRGRFRRVR